MAELSTGLRWGVWGVAGLVLLVLNRTYALDRREDFLVPAANVAAYLTSVAVWAVAGALLATGRLRPRIAGVLLTVSLAAAVGATLVVPVPEQGTGLNWAFGASGWLVLVLALGQPLPRLVPLLLLAPACAFGVAVALAEPWHAEVFELTGTTIITLGQQLLVVLAASQLQRTSEAAAAVEREAAELRTAGEVTDALHADRLQRAEHVSSIVGPVLTQLARLPAGEDLEQGLRHRCAVAGARVRRVLAAWHSPGPDSLSGELDACVDELQRLGLQVDVHVRGPLDVAATVDHRRAVCDLVLTTAVHARQRVRVTVVAARAALRVGILTDAPAGAVVANGTDTSPGPSTGTTRSVGRGTVPDLPASWRTTVHHLPDALWVEAECPLT